MDDRDDALALLTTASWPTTGEGALRQVLARCPDWLLEGLVRLGPTPLEGPQAALAAVERAQLPSGSRSRGWTPSSPIAAR